MRIALIGMSGSGKSFWSSVLSREGFRTFGCDDDIGRRLAEAGEITDASLDSLGTWMGFPFEPGFARREARYLNLEYAVMDDLLTDLESRPANAVTSPLVIDTTGSVIYTGARIMERLRRQTIVVYLALPRAHRQALRRAYQTTPRPVVWRQHFRKHPGEKNENALKRCYDHLLESRETLYRQYAHLEIEWDPVADASPVADTLLAPVKAFMAQPRSSNGL
jgi:shikimate kinase